MAYVPVPKDLTQGQNKISIQFDKTSADFFQSGGGSGSSIIFSAQKKQSDSGIAAILYGDGYVTVLSGMAMYEKDGLPF